MFNEYYINVFYTGIARKTKIMVESMLSQLTDHGSKGELQKLSP